MIGTTFFTHRCFYQKINKILFWDILWLYDFNFYKSFKLVWISNIFSLHDIFITVHKMLIITVSRDNYKRNSTKSTYSFEQTIAKYNQGGRQESKATLLHYHQNWNPWWIWHIDPHLHLIYLSSVVAPAGKECSPPSQVILCTISLDEDEDQLGKRMVYPLHYKNTGSGKPYNETWKWFMNPGPL